jgi:hypothetical protein
MGQKFYASETDTFTFPNGAIGHRSGVQFDCLGPYAKVRNCPIIVRDREVGRLTAYATGYADTWFSIPACTRRKGQHVRGYFTADDPDYREMREGGVQFRVMQAHWHLFDA